MRRGQPWAAAFTGPGPKPFGSSSGVPRRRQAGARTQLGEIKQPQAEHGREGGTHLVSERRLLLFSASRPRRSCVPSGGERHVGAAGQRCPPPDRRGASIAAAEHAQHCHSTAEVRNNRTRTATGDRKTTTHCAARTRPRFPATGRRTSAHEARAIRDSRGTRPLGAKPTSQKNTRAHTPRCYGRCRAERHEGNEDGTGDGRCADRWM